MPQNDKTFIRDNSQNANLTSVSKTNWTNCSSDTLLQLVRARGTSTNFFTTWRNKICEQIDSYDFLSSRESNDVSFNQ